MMRGRINLRRYLKTLARTAQGLLGGCFLRPGSAINLGHWPANRRRMAALRKRTILTHALCDPSQFIRRLTRPVLASFHNRPNTVERTRRDRPRSIRGGFSIGPIIRRLRACRFGWRAADLGLSHWVCYALVDAMTDEWSVPFNP
jgi:hypothetical protein